MFAIAFVALPGGREPAKPNDLDDGHVHGDTLRWFFEYGTPKGPTGRFA